MVMYHLKKLNNNNNTDLVVGGLNSTVLLDYSPANQIETSSILTFATRNSTTASTLTTVTFNSDENSSVRNNYLTDRPDQHETEQTQLSGEKGGGGRVQKKIVLQLRPRNFLQHQAQMAVPNTAPWHFQETTSNALNEQPTNYNTLLHDEIQLTAVSATQTELNAAISTITPAGLNLKEGITGTLLDKVIEFRNKEDSRNGINGVLVQTNWRCAITCNKSSTAYLPDILIQWDVAMHQSQLPELYRHQQPQLKRTTKMKSW